MSARALLVQVDGTPGFPARGIAGIGVVVRGPRGNLLCTRCLRAPAHTNNEAEYQAIIAGLNLVLDHYPGMAVRCMSDSRVVIDQLCGRAAVRAESMRVLFQQARALCAQLRQLELVAIPRELNRLADVLAWEALGGRQAIVGFPNHRKEHSHE